MKAGWKVKAFEDCIERITYTTKIQRKDFQEVGRFPIVSQEEAPINGYWDKFSDVFHVIRPLIVFGDHTRCFKYVDFDFVLGADGVKILQPTDALDARFFYYQLLSFSFASLGYARHYRLLKERGIAIPPFDEQRRIVALLDKAFAGIATATANAQKNLTNVRALFESYVQSVFANQSADWIVQRFEDICENLDSRRRPVTKSVRSFGEIPYYGASGQVDSVADYLFDDDLLLVSEDGANLLMRTYPIAFSISGKSWVNNHAHVLRFSDRDTQAMVEYYLNSISLQPYVSGMAQPKLNQKSLNGIPIPLPPQERRKAVVEQLDALALNVQSLEESYQTKLAALAELKQSLLQKAFAGELT